MADRVFCQCEARLENSVRLSALLVSGCASTTTSSPASVPAWRRNDSRTRRFTRFLSQALRQCFRDIASPSLAWSLPFSLDKTVNKLSRLLLALANTRLYASASGKRLALVNRYPGTVAGPGRDFDRFAIRLCSSGPVLSDAFVFVGCCGVMPLTCRLRCQLRTPFRASPLEHQATGFRCHASAKPVGSRPFQVAWLECAFHCRLTCALKRTALQLGRDGCVKGCAASVATAKNGRQGYLRGQFLSTEPTRFFGNPIAVVRRDDSTAPSRSKPRIPHRGHRGQEPRARSRSR